MKKLLITLTIICFAFGVKAQPDSSSQKYIDSLKRHTWINIANDDRGWVTLIDYNTLDTLKCWFKEGYEVVQNKGTLQRPNKKDSILYAGDTVIYEKWHRGYMIISKYGWVSKIQGKLRHINIENYLYSDRKTVVKNIVLEHIEL